MIRSLQEQTLPDWEALFILDGPTDGSSELVERAAAEDPRIKAIEVANGGAGRARNIGIDHASAEYLAFFDSDDIVPPDALDALIQSLRASGSDIATGYALQTTGGMSGTWPYWTMREGVHASPEVGATLKSRPELIFDHTVWNKVYRAEFLRTHAIRYPEGTTCEDLMFCARAFVAANAVDVLPSTVYVHRRRPGSVTTSGHFSATALRDWISQTWECAQLIGATNDDGVSAVYFRRMLRHEAWTRAAQWVDMDDIALADELASTCSALFNLAPSDVTAELPVAIRAVYLMMSEGSRDLARTVSGTPRPVVPELSEIAELRRLVGGDAIPALSTVLAKHNLVDPVFDLDLAAPDERELERKRAFLRALPELDRVHLLHRSPESVAILDAIESGDHAAVSRIRFGAARPIRADAFKWVPSRRRVELEVEQAERARDAMWISNAGARTRVPIEYHRLGRLIVPAPPAAAMRRGEEFCLLLRAAAPVGAESLVYIELVPQTRRFERLYARRAKEGLLLIRDRGGFVGRVFAGVGSRLRRKLRPGGAR